MLFARNAEYAATALLDTAYNRATQRELDFLTQMHKDSRFERALDATFAADGSLLPSPALQKPTTVARPATALPPVKKPSPL